MTSTDLPDVLNTLRVNLSRNTRGHSRHTPQAAALSWGCGLETTYPSSVYRYDYVLATDVVYHHDFLDELLVTMKHFCQPGTTLIWANKVRFESDLTFTENFKKAFHTSLLYEDGDVKIFMGTCREKEGDSDMGMEIQEEEKEEECNDEEVMEEIVVLTDDKCKEGENGKGDGNNHLSTTTSDEDLTGESSACLVILTCFYTHEDLKRGLNSLILGMSGLYFEWKLTFVYCLIFHSTGNLKQTVVPTWFPSVISSFGKEIYHYAGQDIVIYESIDSFGAVMWPAVSVLKPQQGHFLSRKLRY